MSHRGTPGTKGFQRRDPAERFWEKVEKTDTCWLWMGFIGSGGYGQFWTGERRTSPHRFAYELLKGPVPTGLDLDHICRVRHCVNPDHLEPVTRSENLRRGEMHKPVNGGGRAERQRRKTHCPHGHPYDEENTRWYFYEKTQSWHRACKACHRERTRARRSRSL